MRKVKPSVDPLVKLIQDSSVLQERLRDDPLQALEETKALMELTSVPYEPLIYRWAVLVALGSAAVGALVGLFAPSPIDDE